MTEDDREQERGKRADLELAASKDCHPSMVRWDNADPSVTVWVMTYPSHKNLQRVARA